MLGSDRIDLATGDFAGVEQVAEGQNLQGLSQQEVRALAARAYQWESLLHDDDDVIASATDSRAEISDGILGTDVFQETSSGGSSSVANTPSGVRNDAPVRRGMVRHIFVLVDMTDAMKLNDYRPRRFEFLVDVVLGFASRFLVENPLSSLGIAVLRAGTCEIVSSCTSSVDNLKRRLQEMQLAGPQGRISLVNGLTSALDALKEAPDHSTREALLLVASLSTHDPQETPIDSVLGSLVEKRISVSVISMSPELYILKQACSKTGGTYTSALDSRHFQEILDSYIVPPVSASSSAKPGLVLMGFPRRDNELVELNPKTLDKSGHPHRFFICPRCDTRVRDVPGPCPFCDLPLTSGLLLTRSFQHLFPMTPWIKTASNLSGSLCSGCQVLFQIDRSNKFQCRTCRGHFCEDCMIFCRETLRKCPQCLEVQAKRLRTT